MLPQIGKKSILPQIGNAPSNRGEINTPKETPSFWYAPDKVSGMLPQIGNAPSNRGEINTPKETLSFWYAPSNRECPLK